MNDARGVIYIHSCPAMLAGNVVASISHLVSAEVTVSWADQSVEPGTVHATIEWSGAAGTAARIASALRGWESTRFEVWEATGANRDGVRYVHTPQLGIFFTLTDAVGNAVVNEERIRYAMDVAQGDVDELEHELSLALGTAWDDELEPYRNAATVAVTPIRRSRAAI